MYFKCLVVARMTGDQVSSGLPQRYHWAILPDGSQGHQGSPNCELFVVEQSLPYGYALDKAHAVHVSHVPYQQEQLAAQGYTPVWVYVD
jgi:hypothetical protein